MTNKQITFQGGLRLLAVFLILETLMTSVSNLWQLGPEVPVVEIGVSSLILSSIMVGITWLILRIEGVRLAEIGLSPTLIGPAIVAVGGFFVALNIVGIGLALGAGNSASIGYPWDLSPELLLGLVLFQVIFAGLVEEFLYRGYLQTKLIALLGDDDRVRRVVGIGVASVLFAAMHIPRVVTSSVPGRQSFLQYMGILFVTGFAFGVLYELTHNLYITVFAHGAGNFLGSWGPIFVVFIGWPTWALWTFWIAYVILWVIVIWMYRRWAFDTGRMAVWTSRDDVAFRM